jgi:hypothetical protein
MADTLRKRRRKRERRGKEKRRGEIKNSPFSYQPNFNYLFILRSGTWHTEADVHAARQHELKQHRLCKMIEPCLF